MPGLKARGAYPPAEAIPAGADSDSLAAMPRSFDFSVESPVTVERIQSAFSEEDYWLARLAAFGGIGRLDSLIVDTDGSVTVAIIGDVRHEGLPGLVAKLYPREWQVVQNETWSPIDGGRVRGEVSIATRGAPGSGLGTGFAGTGAERLAPEVHRDRGVQSPVGRRQDRELHRPPAGPTDF